MTEAKQATKTLHAAGWRSRTVWIGCAALVVVVGIATACLFLTQPGAVDEPSKPIATFAQWAGFVGIYVPATFGAMLTALGFEKRQLAKLHTNGGQR